MTMSSDIIINIYVIYLIPEHTDYVVELIFVGGRDLSNKAYHKNLL